MSKAREPWTQKQLGDFFTEAQLRHITQVCNETPDVSEAAARLRPYFQGLREQLEPLGLLPEFAAYAVPYAIAQGKKGTAP